MERDRPSRAAELSAGHLHEVRPEVRGCGTPIVALGDLPPTSGARLGSGERVDGTAANVVDRDHLAALLTVGGTGAVFAACRQALLAGARFQVADPACPAGPVAAIYARRQRHTARVGQPSWGFAEAVAALRAHGDRPVRIGGVRADDPPMHFQLFLDDASSTVVACLAVAPRLRPGERVLLAAEAVQWASTDFPGWVRVRFVDAGGRERFVVDKAPVLGVDAAPGAALPVPAVVPCTVAHVRPGGRPHEVATVSVSTSTAGVIAEDGADTFLVGVHAVCRS